MITRKLKNLFAGFLPVVVDVETAGVNASTDALLEVAACVLVVDDGRLVPGPIWHEHIQPFEGAHLDQGALLINRIIPDHPLRFAKTECDALSSLHEFVEKHRVEQSCHRAILVGHNAHFDLDFINAVCKRLGICSPFHRFRVLDTVTLSMVQLGVSVLAKALIRTKLGYDAEEAHGALYDTIQTAKLFCHLYHESNLKS